MKHVEDNQLNYIYLYIRSNINIIFKKLLKLKEYHLTLKIFLFYACVLIFARIYYIHTLTYI